MSGRGVLCLFHLSCLETGRAHRNSFHSAVNEGFYLLDVGTPDSLADFVRMTDFVSENHRFTADFAFGHLSHLLEYFAIAMKI